MTQEDDSRKPPASFWIRVFWDLCWVWAAVAIAVAIARLLAHDAHLLLVLANSMSLYLYAPAVLMLPFAIWRARRWLALVSGCLFLAQVIWIWPDFWPAASLPSDAADTPALRIFSANVYMANTAPEGLLGEIAASDPDMILLQEFSSAWKRNLLSHPLSHSYPHRVLRVREDSFGAAILSKHPFVDTSTRSVGEVPIISVVIKWQAAPVRVYNWHPLPPRTLEYVEVWNEQYRALFEWLSEDSGPVLIVGDFNATQHALWMRRLARDGYRSAHVQAGRGYAVTFPNGTSLAPPIRLDHALMSEHFWCRHIREGTGQGSDHKPLIADFVLLQAASPTAAAHDPADPVDASD